MFITQNERTLRDSRTLRQQFNVILFRKRLHQLSEPLS